MLKWDSLPYKEYNTLMDFLQNKTYFSAKPFIFKSPIDEKTYTCRFVEKEVFETVAVNMMSGSVTIRED